ncbi:FMN-dependent NADH-azoreductase [Sphingobium chlorophenolicum]|uniref:FMN-dependent NADH-azoreductase n=1 Tax=Sphingobium chlorophenolicum TaxID=46429 RepID=UPI00055F4467|nr:NAD(P)H-dependent oxidoreductase [Sphingobium chlorophenolicum]
MKILRIDSSIMGDHSTSRELTGAIVDKLRGSTDAEVVSRDLVAERLGHATPATLPSAHPLSQLAGPLEGDALAARANSDAILEEFLAADIVVIGAPMYNFTIPTQLKAWVDRILVPGKTFGYSEQGPTGLVSGKRVIVAVTRGGFYGAGSPAAAVEHGDSYLRAALSFIGIKDPEVIVAEGLQVSEDQKTAAKTSANEAIQALAA